MPPPSNPRAKRPKLARPSCRRRRSMLDKLSLEDFAPVRSRSVPGSGGAKSSESVVGEGVARTSDSEAFWVFTRVSCAESVEGGAGASAWSEAGGDRGVDFDAPCAAFFGGIDPDCTENVRGKWAEGTAVARRWAVRERMTECMS